MSIRVPSFAAGKRYGPPRPVVWHQHRAFSGQMGHKEAMACNALNRSSKPLFFYELGRITKAPRPQTSARQFFFQVFKYVLNALAITSKVLLHPLSFDSHTDTARFLFLLFLSLLPRVP